MSKSKDPRDITVYVFGAGIAGLTAAHELMLRNFKVVVVEKQHADPLLNLPPELPCAAGGMAQTQWARIDVGQDDRAVKPRGGPIQRIVSPVQIDDTVDPDNPSGKILDLVKETLERDDNLRVIVQAGADPDAKDGEEKGLERAKAVREKLCEDHKHWIARVGCQTSPAQNDKGNYDWAQFIFQHRLAPGEHGFRFFPSFYRHLFDTMKRTPVIDSQGNQAGPSVYENLIPSEVFTLGLSGRQSISFPRTRAGVSLWSVWRLVQDILHKVGYTLRDIALLQTKFFQYMTSCDDRRRHYEDMSWLDFVDSARYSERCRQHLESSPQAFAALDAGSSDARTQGSSTIQLLFDQLTSNDHVDCTLNGPTSTAWFIHWQQYLQSQGVKFVRAELHKIEDGKPVLRPEQKLEEDSYYVLALSLHEVRELAENFPKQDGDDFDKIIKLLPGNWKEELKQAKPDLPLQHLSGIQYFFDEDIPSLRGHTLYVDSLWGLTSISQPQFWARPRAGYELYRGILSVDIANWYTPGRTPTRERCAWECTPDEIANEVWRQICESTSGALPKPRFYHIDRNIVFSEKGQGCPENNRSPFLVNRTGEFQRRPGKPGEYLVHRDRWVLAGGYMQTWTRLTTMESANESARHAVNALLKHVGLGDSLCSVWKLEDREPADLTPLKILDEKLFKRSAPHFVEILELDRVPEELLPGAQQGESNGRE